MHNLRREHYYWNDIKTRDSGLCLMDQFEMPFIFDVIDNEKTHATVNGYLIASKPILNIC